MREEASLYLIVIVPVVVGTGPLALLGILFVFVGFFLTFFLWSAGTPLPLMAPTEVPETPASEAAERVPPKRRWGGVVFLGPIPLVFGSDPQMTRLMLVLGGILFLALLALTIALLLA
jgi:uncharacterized protein (TIGR00304 family)